MNKRRESEAKLEGEDWLYRLGLFLLFLLCGVAFALQVGGTATEWGTLGMIYIVALPVVFLVVTILLHMNERQDLKLVFFAFFVASFVGIFAGVTGFLAYVIVALGLSASTIEGFVVQQLLSTLFVVIGIILLTKLSGRWEDFPSDMDSLYVKKGNLRLGLIIGVAGFLFFLVIGGPWIATAFFGAQSVTFEQFLAWTPWMLAFVLSNGLREELWARGLILRKLEPLFGEKPSNLLQALIFAITHMGSLSAQYTPGLLIYIVVTFVLGLGMGYLMQKTDSLIGPSLVHAGVDVSVVLAIFPTLS